MWKFPEIDNNIDEWLLNGFAMLISFTVSNSDFINLVFSIHATHLSEVASIIGLIIWMDNYWKKGIKKLSNWHILVIFCKKRKRSEIA